MPSAIAEHSENAQVNGKRVVFTMKNLILWAQFIHSA